MTHRLHDDIQKVLVAEDHPGDVWFLETLEAADKDLTLLVAALRMTREVLGKWGGTRGCDGAPSVAEHKRAMDAADAALKEVQS